MLSRHILTCAVLVVLAATAGCTKRGNDIDVELPNGTKVKAVTAETLRINIASEPPSLDWHKATDTASALVVMNMMEGLTQYDLSDKELNLKPALALKWDASDDARKWKITLRPNVQWSDGAPFTGQQVIDGWKRLLSKETAGEYAYFLFGIKNAQAYNEGKKPWEEVGVKLTGPLELSVELDKPMSYFPYLLTHHSTYPIRLDVVGKGGDRWTEPSNIVTLGPFKLISWQHDKMIALERNDKYYGKDTGELPSIKYLIIYMIQEQATAINLFDSGKLDSVHALPSIELRKQRARKEFRETSRLATYFYAMNVLKPPMDNVLVRRAIATAIDRQQLAQAMNGGQIPLTSWIPPGMFGYEAARGISFDAAKAKELLKQAGYPDPSKLAKIEIKFNTSEDHQLVAENIQAQLKKNLGINVELKNEEWKVFLNTLKSDPPQLYRFGWQADYPDPDNFLSVMTSISENNRTRWKNAKYDELVSRGAGTIDREERKKIYADAQKILVEEDVPVIPLLTSVNHVLVSNRVENYPLNGMEVFAYKVVRLKK
jgi:oligopeptide transport system substrate-binding protein